MSKDNRASAGERWSPSLGIPVWLLAPAVQISGIACRSFNTSWAKVPQIELTSPAANSAFLGSLVHGSATAAVQLHQLITASRS